MSAVTRVVEELRTLARTRKRYVRPAAFPSVVESQRVQKEANRLGLSLDHRDEFLETLHKILLARAKEEEAAAKTDDYPTATVDSWKKFCVAEPAIALLGLIPTTESKLLGERRAKAAQSRGRIKRVKSRTIKNDNHEPIILEEVALLLVSEEPLPREDTPRVSLETFRQDPAPDFNDVTDGLSQARVRRLAVDLVLSYREFHVTLEDLQYSLPLPPSDDGSDDELFFPSMHAFARRRLDNEFLLHVAIALGLAEEKASTQLSRFGWLACVLFILHYQCIAFSLRGHALLAHAGRQADGNLHVFLETMERSELGRQELKGWISDFAPESYEPRRLSKTHRTWLRGLSVAGILISPNVVTESEKQSVVKWIADTEIAEDDDNWPGGLKSSDIKRGSWEIEDSPGDREFLQRCGG